jgi:glycosyltransferase involved in cell wall biosynthesis
MEFKNCNKPLVSVIIPTYNRADLLNRAIKSVLNQTYTNYEIIIIDNHSTDHTKEIISKYNVKFIEINNSGIIAKSRNLGIKNSSGEYIAFLDSDDWWNCRKLEKSILYLEEGADLVYHDMLIIKPKSIFNFIQKIKSRNLVSNVYLDLLQNGNPIANSSVVINKKIIEEVSYISEDPRLLAAEDFDLYIRISRVTDKFKRISKNLGYYWIESNSESKPIRSITYIKRLREIYGSNFVVNDKINLPCWMNYILASSYYKIKKYNESYFYSHKNLTKFTNLNTYLKSFVLFLLSKIFK